MELFNVIPLMLYANYTGGLCGVSLHNPDIKVIHMTNCYSLAVAEFPANFLPLICSPVCSHVFELQPAVKLATVIFIRKQIYLL